MKDKTNAKIGLEIHGYIETEEKLFCRCKNFHDMKIIKPNTNTCPICTGMPGSKPMLPNLTAINKILQIGLMLNCNVNLVPKLLVFQRKHYNWPDMPTGYQRTISGAYSVPVAEKGNFLGIRIREVHLEEDPAAWNPETGKIDYNRAGAPLVEIVTEPDFKNSEQVEVWLRQLILTLPYIKALNKDAGIKADVNVSVKNTERTEIKNVNSVREIVRAINYEVKRHEKEKPIKKETRRWNSELDITELMREKEEQADYRFIPDPDLPIIKIIKDRIEKIKDNLPETPMEKLEKIIKKYKIDKENAKILIKNLEIAELYEKIIEKIDARFALPWITIEWFSVLNYNKKTMQELKINTDHFVELLELLEKNKITPLKAKDIMRRFIPKSFSPKKLLEDNERIDNIDELKEIIKEVLVENEKTVDDYKNGEKKAFNFLMGKVMNATNKRADYQIVRRLLEEDFGKRN